MTTSSFLNSNNRGAGPTAYGTPLARTLVLVLALALALALVAAGCSDEPGASCGDDEPPPADKGAPETAVRRAQLNVRSTTTLTAEGQPSTVVNQASLSLQDSTEVVIAERMPQDISGSCFVLTGAPQQQCRQGYKEPCVKHRLQAETVALSGTSKPVTLAEVSTGTYVADDVPSPMFGSGPIQLAVTGRSDPTYFPTVTLSVAPPDELVVREPLPAGGPVGSKDLEVRWTAGNGDLIQIELQIDRQGDTDKAVCVVRDDGCHTIPVRAFELFALDMRPEEQFKLAISRVKVEATSLDDKTAAEIKAIRRVEMKLPAR